MRWFMMSQLLVGVLMLFSCVRRPLVDPEDAAMLKVRLVTEGIHNVTSTSITPKSSTRPSLPICCVY